MQEPTYRIRKSEERGSADHGWLRSQHSFAFADYFDPEHMGFRALRVINEDHIAPKKGFGMHPHRDMEIFSYIVSGTIAHQDTLGNSRKLGPGEIQLMSAGTGIHHAETNPSATEPLHILQIWISPNENNLPPSYTEWSPTTEQRNRAKALILSPDGHDGSAKIHQNAWVYKLYTNNQQTINHQLDEGRGLWLQLIKGKLSVNGIDLSPGDAFSSEHAGSYSIDTEGSVEALLFDLT